GEPPCHHDAGGLLPHLFTLTTGVSGESFRRWRSPFCAPFLGLSPPGISPASSPTVSGLSSTPKTPRPPALQPQLYPGLIGDALGRAERRSALRATDPAQHLHDELPADEALEARAAGERGQLLVERAEQRCDPAHESILKTPTTLPSMCTYDGYMGS